MGKARRRGSSEGRIKEARIDLLAPPADLAAQEPHLLASTCIIVLLDAFWFRRVCRGALGRESSPSSSADPRLRRLTFRHSLFLHLMRGNGPDGGRLPWKEHLCCIFVTAELLLQRTKVPTDSSRTVPNFTELLSGSRRPFKKYASASLDCFFPHSYHYLSPPLLASHLSLGAFPAQNKHQLPALSLWQQRNVQSSRRREGRTGC